MFKYIKNVYNQCISIYKIKKQLQFIHNQLPYNTNINELIPAFQNLKKLIFSCGSIYIKLFQWYISKLKSNIIDDFKIIEKTNTNKFINYFEDIFENCPHHSLEHTQEIFKNSICNTNIEDYVDITTLKVIASGSIGQIYYARRAIDNIEIAIKVKHPDIAQNLNNQLTIIKLFKFAQSFKYIKNKFKLIFNIDDFLNDIIQQCDFRIEASNSIKFRENFSNSSKFIVIPEILVISEHVLISNYISGIPLEDLTKIQYHYVTLNFVCFFYQMLFVDNFIHGDLHCKNWKVRITESGNAQLIIYDCGICFSNINVEITKNFWFGIAKYDMNKISDAISNFITISNVSELNININNEINNIFNNILKNSLSISLLLKLIVQFFTLHNFMVHKFLINLSILICVIEEFLQKGDIINRENTNSTGVNMFELINDSQLDIIAFCDVNKCYPDVAKLFKKELDNKFIEYKTNIENNKINENNDITKCNIQPILFSTLSISNLKFISPE